MHTSNSPVRTGLTSSPPNGSAVLSLICADATGPLLITLWNYAVSAFVEGFKEACIGDGYVVLTLENFRVLDVLASQRNGS